MTKPIRLFYLPILAAWLLIFHGQCLAQRPDTSTDKLPLVQVKTGKVTKDKATSQTEIVGTVQAVQRAVIAAKISGTISDISVVLGSKVSKGDLLIKISAGEISARVLQAQAQLEQAKRNLDREKKLLKKQAATTETVKSVENIFKVSQATYQEAKTMLNYTRITAPFDGLITSKPANTGDLATPGNPLLHLENNQKMQINAPVPEALVLGIKQGDKLTVHIPAAKIRLTGTVAEVAPSTDPLSRTAPIKIDIEKTNLLRSGQFARVLVPGTPIQTLYIPLTAVIHHGQMKKVFVINKDTRASLRLIRTGTQTNDRIEIIAGLDENETIIVEGNKHLIDGQNVEIVQ